MSRWGMQSIKSGAVCVQYVILSLPVFMFVQVRVWFSVTFFTLCGIVRPCSASKTFTRNIRHLEEEINKRNPPLPPGSQQKQLQPHQAQQHIQFLEREHRKSKPVAENNDWLQNDSAPWTAVSFLCLLLLVLRTYSKYSTVSVWSQETITIMGLYYTLLR